MDDFKLISVKKGKEKGNLDVSNPTSYHLIGKGYHGAVFQLDDERCVKIYHKLLDVKPELDAMKALQGLSYVPKVLETGPNYIIMEYLKGPNLRDYLEKKGELSESISQQILLIINGIKQAGYIHLDDQLKHFIVTEQEVVKVVDIVDLHRKTKVLYPVRMFKELRKLRLLKTFLGHARKLEPKMYAEWMRKLDFDHL
jgi:RIO-like serine/threonine protein kinase